MKVKLEFDENERQEALEAMNAWKYKYAFSSVWDRVFRPNNKHGYNNELLDKESSYEVIEELMKIYQEVNQELIDELGE